MTGKYLFINLGEISLRGKVLKIGGVKEKVLAAKRDNITNLILPKANEGDVTLLHKDLKQGITFFFVDSYEEVYKLLF